MDGKPTKEFVVDLIEKHEGLIEYKEPTNVINVYVRLYELINYNLKFIKNYQETILKTSKHHMKILEKIKQKLGQNEIKYSTKEGEISVEASEGGFTVTLYVEPKDQAPYVVFFDGWHEHFENEQEAVNAFGLGLSNRCRVKAEFRGDKAYVWTLEYKENGEWKSDSEIRSLFKPFWKKTKYLQNNLLDNNHD